MAYPPYPWREVYLAALRQRPVILHACRAAGIDRTAPWRARQTDKDFAEAEAQAMEDGIDLAEQEAIRRGQDGYEEPVIDKGRLAYRYERYLEPVELPDGTIEMHERFRPVLDAQGQPVPLTIRKHSDALLLAVLKARRKAYSTERTEVTSPDGSMSPATDEASRHTRVAALMALAQARRAAAGEPDQDFSDLA